MDNYDISPFINGKMKLRIVCRTPEQLLNIFWKRNIKVIDVNRENLYSLLLVINSEYFEEIKRVCNETGSKLSVVSVGKILKLFSNIKVYLTLFIGLALSFGIIVGLSFFIWRIEIKGDKHISPYEIRKIITDMGIAKGTLKSQIDVNELEEQIIEKNKNVLWSKARIYGSTLKIEVVESFKPPVIEIDSSFGTIVASKDGEVVRVYTQSGTAIVEKGKIVKRGDVLIEGYQGKEGNIYEVPPIGSVIAKTFLEFEEVVELQGTKNVNTKNRVDEYYLEIFGRKLYLKKYKDEFQNFERINYDGKFIKKNIYYEVDKSPYVLDPESVKKNLVDYYTKYVNQNLKYTDSIVGVVVKDEIVDNKLILKLSFAIEEDIGIKIKKEDQIN